MDKNRKYSLSIIIHYLGYIFLPEEVLLFNEINEKYRNYQQHVNKI